LNDVDFNFAGAEKNTGKKEKPPVLGRRFWNSFCACYLRLRTILPAASARKKRIPKVNCTKVHVSILAEDLRGRQAPDVQRLRQVKPSGVALRPHSV